MEKNLAKKVNSDGPIVRKRDISRVEKPKTKVISTSSIARSIEEAIEIPSEKNIHIWRYMNFAKFAALLETGALFFTKSDMLQDDFEGSTTLKNYLSWWGPVMQVLGERKAEGAIREAHKLTFAVRQLTYVNSWHMNETEDYAMWKIYSRDENSVAIVSTYQKLRDELPENIYISKVKYIDYNKDDIPRENNIIIPFMFKRQQFQFEREIRAFFTDIGEKHPLDYKAEDFPLGKEVKINLPKLVERIVVSPYADEWFVELVTKIIARYRLDVKIEYSALKAKPVYI